MGLLERAKHLADTEQPLLESGAADALLKRAILALHDCRCELARLLEVEASAPLASIAARMAGSERRLRVALTKNHAR